MIGSRADKLSYNVAAYIRQRSRMEQVATTNRLLEANHPYVMDKKPYIFQSTFPYNLAFTK